MSTWSLRTCSAIALAVMLGASPCAAQTGVEFAPVVGFYRPAEHLIAAPPALPGLAQQQAIAVGGRLSVWLSRRLGVEAAFAYAGSSVRGQDSECGNLWLISSEPDNAFPSGGLCPPGLTPYGSFAASERVGIADLHVLLRIPTHSTTTEFYLSAGPSYISHAGWATTRSVAGGVGGGVRMPIRGTGMHVCIVVEDYLYSTHYVVPSATYYDLTEGLDNPALPGVASAQFQSDFLVSVGVSVPLHVEEGGRGLVDLLADIGRMLIP